MTTWTALDTIVVQFALLVATLRWSIPLALHHATAPWTAVVPPRWRAALVNLAILCLCYSIDALFLVRLALLLRAHGVPTW